MSKGKKWAERAVSRYKAQNGGKLEAPEATKEDLKEILQLATSEIDRLKKKVKDLQKAARYQKDIFDGAKRAVWLDKHLADLMEPES